MNLTSHIKHAKKVDNPERMGLKQKTKPFFDLGQVRSQQVRSQKPEDLFLLLISKIIVFSQKWPDLTLARPALFRSNFSTNVS